MFQDVVITGGQFNYVENGNHTYDAVSTILLPHIATGAMFDSAERYPPGRCHAGTRERIIEHITDWIRDDQNPQRVLWLYGSAGAGKSAIMQSICEMLQNGYWGMYGGSFFFARGHADRGTGEKLVSTLSYQLASHFPTLRMTIQDTLFLDPTIPTKSINIQFYSLLINPVQGMLDDTPILIIDGLDECNPGKAAQCHIIQLIATAIKDCNSPLRFIIASRPEYWIREAFEKAPLSNVTFSLSLRDDIDADRDIRKYLHDEFERIHRENFDIMGSVDLPWPPTGLLDHFVCQASGQYIYASTVIKFIGHHSDFSDPQEQLRILAEPGSHQATAFSDLDHLYATILSAFPNMNTIKNVLGALLVCTSPLVIRHILGVKSTDLTLSLKALSSLVEFSAPSVTLTMEEETHLIPIFGPGLAGEVDVKFCHLSFREFLEDKSRSGPYHVDPDPIFVNFMTIFFDVIHRNIDRNYDTEPHSYFGDIGLESYRSMMDACSTCSIPNLYVAETLQACFPIITSMTAKLQSINRDVKPMGYPACFLWDVNWLRQFINGFKAKIREPGSPFTFPIVLSEDLTSLHKHAWSLIMELRRAVFAALRTGRLRLSLCDGFSITPTIMTIEAFGGERLRGFPQSWLRVPETYPKIIFQLKHLFTIPGNNTRDSLSSLQEHRHIIRFDKTAQELGLRIMYLGGPPDNEISEGWISTPMWENQRFLLAWQCMKSLRSNSQESDWETISGNDTKHYIFRDFFHNNGASDIQSKEYFENQDHLSFLELMIENTVWVSNIASRPKLWRFSETFVIPVLRWFNRQLTDAQTLRFMDDHDPSLRQRMKGSMTVVFQHLWLPIITTPYFSTLVISSDPHAGQSVVIRVRSSYHLEEHNTDYSPPEYHEAINLGSVHCELFGLWPATTKAPSDAVDVPVLEPTSWLPHLASYLLNILVKYLYSLIHYSYYGHVDLIEDLSSDRNYMFKCILYAEPSQQNLDALRAIRYLYAQAGGIFAWVPPWEFSSWVTQLLAKYPRSVLSSEEWDAFTLWISDLKILELGVEEKRRLDTRSTFKIVST